MSQVITASEVLTLEEVADYLRLPVEVVERQAAQGRVPGRKIEENWRFLKAAIDDWLRAQDKRARILQMAGAFADDENMAALRTEIYKQRGRPEVETDE
ncbi:MAG: helix-turn-helix domain-containing protein [Acidobacteriota bacterium]